MAEEDLKKSVMQKMKKSIESFQTDLAKIRTGRPHPSFLDRIMVDYYGSPTPLNQVANVSLQDSRTLAVSVWDTKMVQAVDRAIRESDLGLNPQPTGDMIRVPMPLLSGERRRELVKIVGQQAEEAKIALRNIRRDANDLLKQKLKDKSISEDDFRRVQEEIQKIMEKHTSEIDSIRTAKEQEIMTVS